MKSTPQTQSSADQKLKKCLAELDPSLLAADSAELRDRCEAAVTRVRECLVEATVVYEQAGQKEAARRLRSHLDWAWRRLFLVEDWLAGIKGSEDGALASLLGGELCEQQRS